MLHRTFVSGYWQSLKRLALYSLAIVATAELVQSLKREPKTHKMPYLLTHIFFPCIHPWTKFLLLPVEVRSKDCNVNTYFKVWSTDIVFFFASLWKWIITNFFIIKPNKCANITIFLAWNSICFGQFVCPSSGVYSLYTQHWFMSYRFVDPVPSWSCSKVVYKPVWHISLLCVQWINSWWWTEELSEICRVSCQNKFVKLMHLVGFIIKKHGFHVTNILYPSSYLTVNDWLQRPIF